MKGWLKVIAVLFVLPVFAICFLTYAPIRIENEVKTNLKTSLAQQRFEPEALETYKYHLERLDLQTQCASTEESGPVYVFALEPVCNEFTYFSYIRTLSYVLIVLGLLHILMAYGFAKTAARSQDSLLRSFRLAWKSAIFFSLMILIGQTVLSGFISYWITTVFSNTYYPKLIGILVIGGLLALYNIIKMLLSKMPIETNEGLAQEVKREDAPDLWSALSAIATKLEIPEPDTVLVGLGTSFYVTEFPVHHANGTAMKRTLHLSAPMMKQMTKDEVLSVIGHEFGHFKGDDTVFSTHMTPLLVRTDHTIHHLFSGGFAAWPAAQAMSVFSNFFNNIVSSSRRDRELLADSWGASVTSPETAAMALIRYSLKADAHAIALNDHILSKSSFDDSFVKVHGELLADEKYWSDLKAQALPHPYDSHPPMLSRIEKLGFTIDGLRSRATAPVEGSGFDAFFANSPSLFAHVEEKNSAILKEQQTRLEFIATPAEEFSAETIRDYFPEVVLKARVRTLVIIFGFLGFAAIVLLSLILLVKEEYALRSVLAVFLLGTLYLTYRTWRVQRHATLTINHLGIQRSTWKRLLRFDEVATITPVYGNGTLSLLLNFHDKQLTLNKWPWFPKLKHKAMGVDLSNFEGNVQENADRILRYYLKETK